LVDDQWQLFTEIKSAEIMNGQISQYYNKPPFIEGGKVGVFETDGTQKFVHVYDSNIKSVDVKGQFIPLKSDIEGLTPSQIKNKYDLPNLPTHIADVNLPKGTEVSVGTVNPNNFGGQGLGTQFYILDEAHTSWFINFKEIK
jgi:filamentous hemagglutinin